MTRDGIGGGDRRDEEPDAVARLIRLAGPRPDVPDERARRVKAAVRGRWQEEVRARRRRSRWLLGALVAAATFLVTLGLAVTRTRVATPPELSVPAATVEVVAGSVGLVAPAGGGTVRLGLGDLVPARSTVSTGADSRAAFRLASGASLRVDRATRLTIASAQDVLLEQGTVYVDNAAAGARGSLQVRTGLGVLQDIGTQFEVRVGESVLRLRVREGTVRLFRSTGSETAGAGVELTVDARRQVVRRSVPAAGHEWAWTIAIAPSFALEGRRLPEFLRWAVRETGWRLEFASPQIEESMRDVVLHGSVGGLAPEQALAAVLPTCGLAFRVEDGALRVGREGPQQVGR
jgi:hypothetical protein